MSAKKVLRKQLSQQSRVRADTENVKIRQQREAERNSFSDTTDFELPGWI
jgi:hypothetical protein